MIMSVRPEESSIWPPLMCQFVNDRSSKNGVCVGAVESARGVCCAVFDSPTVENRRSLSHNLVREKPVRGCKRHILIISVGDKQQLLVRQRGVGIRVSNRWVDACLRRDGSEKPLVDELLRILRPGQDLMGQRLAYRRQDDVLGKRGRERVRPLATGSARQR